MGVAEVHQLRCRESKPSTVKNQLNPKSHHPQQKTYLTNPIFKSLPHHLKTTASETANEIPKTTQRTITAHIQVLLQQHLLLFSM
jgi:hypothetical protein